MQQRLIYLTLKQYNMADLHVQPKRKNNSWLWILLLIIIAAAAIYYFAVYKKDHPNDQAYMPVPVQIIQVSPAAA